MEMDAFLTQLADLLLQAGLVEVAIGDEQQVAGGALRTRSVEREGRTRLRVSMSSVSGATTCATVAKATRPMRIPGFSRRRSWISCLARASLEGRTSWMFMEAEMSSSTTSSAAGWKAEMRSKSQRGPAMAVTSRVQVRPVPPGSPAAATASGVERSGSRYRS